MRKETSWPSWAIGGFSLALAGCGGGGSGVSSTAADLTVSGTAAIGAAIAAAKVDVKCATGSGSVTTGADGSFSITVAGGARPCTLRVPNGASSLHSLVEAGSGTTVTANITPLTDLLTALVAGGPADALFTTFDATAQGRASAAALATAKADLASALKAQIDLTGLDPLTGAAAVGSALDSKLIALATALGSANLSLDALATALVANPGSPGPVQTILQTSATTCAGLRSGRYRAINPGETDPVFATQVIQIDATALTVKQSDGTVGTLTDLGNCAFDTLEGTLLVAPSGFAVFHSSVSAFENALLIPEQTIALSELAGTWNFVSYDRDASTLPFKPTTGYFTLDAAGHPSSNFTCTGQTNCVAESAGAGIAVSSGGGFESVEAGGTVKIFAFKTASGGIIFVALPPGQSGLAIATKQIARTLPAVGDVTKNRSFTIGSNGASSAISADETRTVTAVNTTAQSYTRVRQSDGQIDGFSINSPRNGMFYRPASVSPINGGGTSNVSEILLMPLPGGASVFTSVTAPASFLGFSINHP